MKFFRFLFSPVMMGTLLVIFAAAMAAATFIENDYGSQAAYASVYNTRWFELILLLLAVNLTGQLIIFKMFRKEKLPIALFHLSFILMIAGAGITRYFGWEGSMHIREGESSYVCYSDKEYIGYSLKNSRGSLVSEYSKPFSLAGTSGFDRGVKFDEKKYEILLARVIPNAYESVVDDPSGEPMISLLLSKGMMTREEIILKKGGVKSIQGMTVGFESTADCDLKIFADSGNFFIESKSDMSLISMMTGESVTSTAGSKAALKTMQIISVNDIKIVPQSLTFSGSLRAVPADPKKQSTGKTALIFHVFSGKESKTITIWNSQKEPFTSGTCSIDGYELEVFYGSRQVRLPFSIRLDDFVLERYPGSSSPSGYKSNVILLDNTENVVMPFSIFMNNILKYKGYRFYQSSFDNDEQGTILSVNHDPAGLIVTYSGYTLLFLFIVLSLIAKASQFRTIKAGAWKSALRKTAAAIMFLIMISGFSEISAQRFVPGKESSSETGKILVQDQKGRTKPLFTLSSDILRKVSRESKLGEYNPMQVFLGLCFDFDNWKDVPLIKVSNGDLRKSLGIRGDMASFSDLVSMDEKGTYKLSGLVNAAYEKSPATRNKFDKEVMKVDERVNIVYMIYKGDFMKIFPLRDGTTNWGSAEEALRHAPGKEDSTYLENIVPLLIQSLQVNNSLQARQIAESVSGYQQRFGGYELPPESKVRAETIYYKTAVFEKLFPFYATVGILMIAILIIIVITGKRGKQLSLVRGMGWLLLAGFILHTAGLALRWYISGHSPMSNGYESLIFISWVTMLAGFIFSRKSDFALAATSVLAGFTLLVAHMTFMDPEITNLVPVLKSYWLTLHVSVIISSYGFLGLGAILGIITMILFILVNDKNRERISDTIDELAVLNFRTLTLGLYFLTTGTFLGAVWANESWGRYWGWDPKETWSLITIIVYTLVTHSRMIPGMKNVFAFNLLSLFGFSSVLMTYFGVNYYLSGLHSYASGDPVPVPGFIYVAVIVLVALCIAAYMKYRKYDIKPTESVD